MAVPQSRIADQALSATERTRLRRHRQRETLELTVRQLLEECRTWLPTPALRGLSNASLRDLRAQLVRALGADQRGEVSAS